MKWQEGKCVLGVVKKGAPGGEVLKNGQDLVRFCYSAMVACAGSCIAEDTQGSLGCPVAMEQSLALVS